MSDGRRGKVWYDYGHSNEKPLVRFRGNNNRRPFGSRGRGRGWGRGRGGGRDVNYRRDGHDTAGHVKQEWRGISRQPTPPVTDDDDSDLFLNTDSDMSRFRNPSPERGWRTGGSESEHSRSRDRSSRNDHSRRDDKDSHSHHNRNYNRGYSSRFDSSEDNSRERGRSGSYDRDRDRTHYVLRDKYKFRNPSPIRSPTRPLSSNISPEGRGVSYRHHGRNSPEYTQGRDDNTRRSRQAEEANFSNTLRDTNVTEIPENIKEAVYNRLDPRLNRANNRYLSVLSQTETGSRASNTQINSETKENTDSVDDKYGPPPNKIPRTITSESNSVELENHTGEKSTVIDVSYTPVSNTPSPASSSGNTGIPEFHVPLPFAPLPAYLELLGDEIEEADHISPSSMTIFEVDVLDTSSSDAWTAPSPLPGQPDLSTTETKTTTVPCTDRVSKSNKDKQQAQSNKRLSKKRKHEQLNAELFGPESDEISKSNIPSPEDSNCRKSSKAKQIPVDSSEKSLVVTPSCPLPTTVCTTVRPSNDGNEELHSTDKSPSIATSGLEPQVVDNAKEKGGLEIEKIVEFFKSVEENPDPAVKEIVRENLKSAYSEFSKSKSSGAELLEKGKKANLEDQITTEKSAPASPTDESSKDPDANQNAITSDSSSMNKPVYSPISPALSPDNPQQECGGGNEMDLYINRNMACDGELEDNATNSAAINSQTETDGVGLINLHDNDTIEDSGNIQSWPPTGSSQRNEISESNTPANASISQVGRAEDVTNTASQESYEIDQEESMETGINSNNEVTEDNSITISRSSSMLNIDESAGAFPAPSSEPVTVISCDTHINSEKNLDKLPHEELPSNQSDVLNENTTTSPTSNSSPLVNSTSEISQPLTSALSPQRSIALNPNLAENNPNESVIASGAMLDMSTLLGRDDLVEVNVDKFLMESFPTDSPLENAGSLSALEVNQESVIEDNVSSTTVQEDDLGTAGVTWETSTDTTAASAEVEVNSLNGQEMTAGTSATTGQLGTVPTVIDLESENETGEFGEEIRQSREGLFVGSGDDRLEAIVSQMKAVSASVQNELGQALMALHRMSCKDNVVPQILAFRVLKKKMLKSVWQLDTVDSRIRAEELSRGNLLPYRIIQPLETAITVEELSDYFLKLVAVNIFLGVSAFDTWKIHLMTLHYKLSRLLNYYSVGHNQPQKVEINFMNILQAAESKISGYTIQISELVRLWDHLRNFPDRSELDEPSVQMDHSNVGIQGYATIIDSIARKARQNFHKSRGTVPDPLPENESEPLSFDTHMRIIEELSGVTRLIANVVHRGESGARTVTLSSYTVPNVEPINPAQYDRVPTTGPNGVVTLYTLINRTAINSEASSSPQQVSSHGSTNAVPSHQTTSTPTINQPIPSAARARGPTPSRTVHMGGPLPMLSGNTPISSLMQQTAMIPSQHSAALNSQQVFIPQQVSAARHTQRRRSRPQVSVTQVLAQVNQPPLESSESTNRPVYQVYPNVQVSTPQPTNSMNHHYYMTPAQVVATSTAGGAANTNYSIPAHDASLLHRTYSGSNNVNVQSVNADGCAVYGCGTLSNTTQQSTPVTVQQSMSGLPTAASAETGSVSTYGNQSLYPAQFVATSTSSYHMSGNGLPDATTASGMYIQQYGRGRHQQQSSQVLQYQQQAQLRAQQYPPNTQLLQQQLSQGQQRQQTQVHQQQQVQQGTRMPQEEGQHQVYPNHSQVTRGTEVYGGNSGNANYAFLNPTSAQFHGHVYGDAYQ